MSPSPTFMPPSESPTFDDSHPAKPLGFSPESLRTHLREHHVEFPEGATHAQLDALFDEVVIPIIADPIRAKKNAKTEAMKEKKWEEEKTRLMEEDPRIHSLNADYVQQQEELSQKFQVLKEELWQKMKFEWMVKLRDECLQKIEASQKSGRVEKNRAEAQAVNDAYSLETSLNYSIQVAAHRRLNSILAPPSPPYPEVRE